MRSPSDLIKQASVMSHRRTWYENLGVVQQLYVDDVVKFMAQCPDATVRSVALALKKELNLAAGLTTIRDTLQALKDEKEKS